MNDLREKVAYELINYRSINNLTQTEAAKKFNISNKTLNRIENRNETVREITLMKILNEIRKER